MIIAGLQKMTLLDYPGRVACTVFLQGCNMRCPFCHNSALLPPKGESMLTMEALMAFLQKRKGLLEAVCVSGGEPTLNPELPELLREIKSLGYLVKLDTNGSRPDVLRQLVEAGLVDYVAMDVKNSPDRYARTVGCPGFDLAPIEESLRFLLSGQAAYELRTTVVQELHDDASIREMGAWVQGLVPDAVVGKFFIQPFADRESVLSAGLHTPETMELAGFVKALQPFAEEVGLRG